MSVDYETHCKRVKAVLGENIIMICEKCYYDWSNECDNCDAIFSGKQLPVIVKSDDNTIVKKKRKSRNNKKKVKNITVDANNDNITSHSIENVINTEVLIETNKKSSRLYGYIAVVSSLVLVASCVYGMT